VRSPTVDVERRGPARYPVLVSTVRALTSSVLLDDDQQALSKIIDILPDYRRSRNIW
jgi:hypothetical protein